MKKIIQSHQFKTMPWKNGLGVTSEIRIVPEGADFTQNNFYWRLSSAQVKAKNTFSNFPGYDRLLIVLTGDGLKLNDRKLLPHEVYKFQGEEQIECSLLGAPVDDLGIIYDRKIYNCEMQVLSLDRKTNLKLSEGVHFVKALSGDASFDKMNIETSDLLNIEGAGQCEIDSTEFPAKILIVKVQKLLLKPLRA